MSEQAQQRKVMIECENLMKIYKTDEIEVVALQGLDLTVHEGELMAIIGNSGSGKSTLLNMIGGLDHPSAGSLTVDGIDLFKLKGKEMVHYLRDTIGFVWQNNARNLIPYLTALENVNIFMNLSGKRKKEEALALLELVGMAHRKDNKLIQLSGGEQQRVAIAIALCNNPRILLADEPTGSVDTRTSDQILDLFRKLNTTFSLTILIVTHDRNIANKVDRVVAIRDGRTSTELIRKKSYAQELAEMEAGNTPMIPDDSHEELTVLDKTGHMQISNEYLSALGLVGRNKIKVTLEGNKIVLTAPEEKS